MKNIKCSFLIVILYFIFLLSTAYAEPIVSLELSTPDIYVGDNFYVNVIADGVTDVDPWGYTDELLAFGFDLDYESAEFTYNGATVGPNFDDNSGLFADTDVAGIAFPGLTGDDILLASLSFTSLLAGNYSLGITSNLFDFNEGLITLFYSQIDITNSLDVNVVPAPATMLLFGTGIAGLVGFRKKFMES